MPQPYKQVYKLPNGLVVTSVVMDKKDFDLFCDDLKGLLHTSNMKEPLKRADDDQVEKIRQSQHLPLMARGTKTQKFFDQFEVNTDYLCAIVRGSGREVYEKYVSK